MRSAIVVATLLASSIATAQGTAPPTPDPRSPPEAPAPQAEVSELKSKLQTMYDEFRGLKNRLPFQLGAGAYLFYYQPLDNTTFSPTDKNGSFQLYAFYLKIDSELATSYGAFGGHAELRMRDGGHIGPGSSNQYLRGFFSSNLWFQELYAYYRPWQLLTIKAGKVYRKVGIFWDDSFFGNLQYFDGQKLNPDYGAEIAGERSFKGGQFTLGYSAQYFLNSDGINGSLIAGRTVGAAPMGGDLAALRTYSPSPEAEVDSAGNRMTQVKNVVDGRVDGVWQPRPWIGADVAVSGLYGTVRRVSTVDMIDDQATYAQVAADATMHVGPVIAYGEYLRQFGPALRDADYLLVGARATFRRLSLRFNTSYVNYHLAPRVQEYILQPGLTYTIGGGLAALVEYDEWQRKDPRLDPGWKPYDRSMNFVLAYSY
jgi:hypothetical protein